MARTSATELTDRALERGRSGWRAVTRRDDLGRRYPPRRHRRPRRRDPRGRRRHRRLLARRTGRGRRRLGHGDVNDGFPSERLGRSRPAARGPRPDRPRVRAAAERRGARARGRHVGRAPQPPVPPRLRRAALLLPDDPPDRAGHGARCAAATSASPRSASRSAAPRSAPSAPASPNWSGCRRAPTAAPKQPPSPACTPASPNRPRDPSDPDQSEIKKRPTERPPKVAAWTSKFTPHILPHTDPDASIAFYRDKLGWEIRNDVGYQGMRWLTVGPADQPDIKIVLFPPGPTPASPRRSRRTIAEMMAKGTYARVNLPRPTSTATSSAWWPPTSTWSKSRPTSPTGSAKARSATRPAT